MFKNVTFIIAAAALLIPSAMQARYLTPDEALRNVNASSGIKRAVAATTDNYRLVYSATDSVSHQPTVYVFARTQGPGFIVAAASDLVTPVLGYSDSATPYSGAENPEFEYWISCYTEAIVNAEANGTERIRTAPAKASRSDIAPLVTSRWNQSDPYNQECPIVAGGRSVTGCVATAFAQVMYHHKWPKEAGTGSHSYTWKVNGTEYSESMDFSTVTFDWANMTDTYSSSSTAAQKAAVAKLMHAVGVGAEMGYTPSSSGAVTLRAAKALLTYWNYDKGASGMSRSSYSLDDWSDIIYAELAANRPVIYDGQSSGGGHCFICDGYQASTGYFHFNWGWGGHYDGYFVLTDLTPGKGGIGGTTSDDGYNQGQGIVIGIQPAIEGSDYRYSMSLGVSLAPEAKVYDKLSWIYIPGQFQNTSLVDLTFAPGLKLVDRTNPSNVQYVLYTPEKYFDDDSWYTCPPGSYYSRLPIRGLVIPPGSYDASFIFKVKEGEWQEMSYGPDIVGTFRIDANTDYVAIGGAALPTQEKHFKCINKDVTAERSLYSRGSLVTLSGSFWNATGSTVDFNMGLKFTDNSDPTKVYYTTYLGLNASLPSQYAYSSWYGYVPDDIPDGEYTVTPAYRKKDTDVMTDFDRNSAIKDYCIAKINSEYAAFDSELPGEPVEVTSTTITPANSADGDAYYFGHKYTAEYQLQLTGNGPDSWSSYAILYLTDPDGNETKIGSKSISSSSTFPLTFSSTFTLPQVGTPGEYKLTVWRANYSGASRYSELASKTISVGYNPDESALEVQDCGWYGKAKSSGPGTQNDPIILLRDNAKIRMQVHNYSAPYSKPVKLTIFGDRGSSSFYSEAYANFTLTCGTDETKEVVIDLLYDASTPADAVVYDGEEQPEITTELIPLNFYSGRTSLDKDKLYLMYIQSADDNSYLYPQTYFKISSDLFTGVEGVAVDRDETPRYFDLTGREVTSPIPGTIYIRIIGGKATKLIYR